MASRFLRWAATTATVSGSWQTFVVMLLCVVWAVSGPVFGFSVTWQLVITTATAVVTVLIVFLIQNTQNRHTLAVHLELDDPPKAIEGRITG